MRPKFIGEIRRFRTRHFDVRVWAEVDEDVDLSWADEETIAAIASGKYIVFGVRCEVRWTAKRKNESIVLSQDSLWGCVRESIDDFQDHRGAGTRGGYFADMVYGCIEQARDSLRAIAKTVKVRG